MLELTKMPRIDLGEYVDNPDDYFIGDDFLYEDESTPKWASLLAGARSRDNMSRREAAVRLGISPKELKAIEKGLKQPSKSLAFRMHQVYNVSLRTVWDHAV